MLQLHELKILNSSKTWPHRGNLTTVLKSAPQNYPENALTPQSPWNSFKIVDLCYWWKENLRRAKKIVDALCQSIWSAYGWGPCNWKHTVCVSVVLQERPQKLITSSRCELPTGFSHGVEVSCVPRDWTGDLEFDPCLSGTAAVLELTPTKRNVMLFVFHPLLTTLSIFGVF